MKLLAYRKTSVLVLATAGLLSLGSQDSCNTMNNVGIAPTTYNDEASPPIRDSSREEPVIVTRDNPWMVGMIATTANGVESYQGGGLYDHASHWDNLHGAIDLLEYRSDRTLNALYSAPILPHERQTAPAFHKWATRSFDLVHGNTYQASLAGIMGSPQTQLIAPSAASNPLWIKLDDQVQVVPIVVVSLLQEPNDDRTFPAKALFDFIPYDHPPYHPSRLSSQDIRSPNINTTILDPAAYEIPPDEIWQKCDIQTQVVTSYTFEVEPDWSPPCSKATGFFMGQAEIESRIKATGWFGQYIVDTLRPIYVVYSSACQCLSCDVGNMEKPQLVEVVHPMTNGKPVTAHEIGHVLLGEKHSDDPDNLMREKPDSGATKLDDPEQCESAWRTAKKFSDRYREFNIDMGRALFEPYDSFALAGDEPTISDLGATSTTDLDQLLPVCCERESGLTWQSSHDCMVSFGQVVADSECMICCVDELAALGWGGPSEVSIQPIGTCSDSAVVSDSWCDQVCCSEYGPDNSVTRWHCSQVGGEVIDCKPS